MIILLYLIVSDNKRERFWKMNQPNVKCDVSVIIVNYNSAPLTIQCINSIKEKTRKLRYEIIVIDNSSDDESIRVINELVTGNIRIIKSKKNLGFGRANNLASTIARGKYLFFLNPDTLLINNAIYYLYRFLEHNKNVGIAGGNLFTIEREPCPSYCEHFDDLKLERKQASWIHILGNKIIEKASKYGDNTKKHMLRSFNYTESPTEVAYVFGADMMISKDLFIRAGKFDQDIFMYSEEQELAWQVLKKGYCSVNVPEAKIIHLEGATSKENGIFDEKYFRRRLNGIMIYFYKRFGKSGLDTFYRLREKRYKRLLLIYRLHHGNAEGSFFSKELIYLQDEYFKVLEIVS